MITGQLPMEESESKDMLRKMLKRSFGAIKPINEHRYAPDEELCRIIEKMMKIELKARYQSMDAVVVDLGHYKAMIDAAKSGAASSKQEEANASFLDSIFMVSELLNPEVEVLPQPPRPSITIERRRRPRASSASRHRPRSRTRCASTFRRWDIA